MLSKLYIWSRVFFGRMFDYGTVIITGIGIGSVSLKYIPIPYQVRKEIENIKTHPREVMTEQSAVAIQGFVTNSDKSNTEETHYICGYGLNDAINGKPQNVPTIPTAP